MKDDIKPAKKIIDVSAPGKSAPSATAKPVIVTNRPLVKDPMVNATAEPEEAAEPDAKAVVHKALVLTPSEDAVKAAEETKADTEPPKQEETAQPAPAKEPPTKPEAAEAVKPEEATPPATLVDAGEATEEAPENTAMPDDEADKEAKKRADHQAAIQKLVDSKQFFLPINMVEKRRTKQFVVLGLLLAIVLALIWVDIALDAGLIHLGGIKPLTHFFSS